MEEKLEREREREEIDGSSIRLLRIFIFMHYLSTRKFESFSDIVSFRIFRIKNRTFDRFFFRGEFRIRMNTIIQIVK